MNESSRGLSIVSQSKWAVFIDISEVCVCGGGFRVCAVFNQELYEVQCQLSAALQVQQKLWHLRWQNDAPALHAFYTNSQLVNLSNQLRNRLTQTIHRHFVSRQSSLWRQPHCWQRLLPWHVLHMIQMYDCCLSLWLSLSQRVTHTHIHRLDVTCKLFGLQYLIS